LVHILRNARSSDIAGLEDDGGSSTGTSFPRVDAATRDARERERADALGVMATLS